MHFYERLVAFSRIRGGAFKNPENFVFSHRKKGKKKGVSRGVLGKASVKNEEKKQEAMVRIGNVLYDLSAKGLMDNMPLFKRQPHTPKGARIWTKMIGLLLMTMGKQ